MPAPAACFAIAEAENGLKRGVSVGVIREGSCVWHQSLAVKLGAGYCCWDGGAPVAATAAATACRAADLAATALAGLEGTTADADPGVSPAAATAWALAEGPVSTVVSLLLAGRFKEPLALGVIESSSWP
jgi:hypothetical protein